MKTTDVKRNKIFIWEKSGDEREGERESAPHSILRKIIMKQMWPVATFMSYSEDDVMCITMNFHSSTRSAHTQTEYFISHIIDTQGSILPMSEFVPLQNECVCEYEHVDIHFMMCIYCHIGSIILWKYARKNRRIKHSICVRCKGKVWEDMGMKRLNIKTWKITSCHSQLWN